MGEQIPQVIEASPLSGRSLKLRFDNGAVRLFDGRRLRGPKYVALTNPEIFCTAQVTDGGLSWQDEQLQVAADFLYQNSVPYDENAVPKEYVPTRREIIGERVITVLAPLAVIIGICGLVWWWIHN